jgi:molybdopterin synthase catalytic subunit
MIQITDQPISPEYVVAQTKTTGSGCVVTYVGLIRDNSQGKAVKSVEYRDPDGRASDQLQKLADETRGKMQVENISIFHRIGVLKVGDINLVVAVAAAHRGEGFTACSYIIDQFKSSLPTQKKELYL